MPGLKYLIGEGLRVCLRPFGYTISPLKRRAQYIDAAETLAAASAAGQSVSEYVADLWGEQGVTEHVLEQMEACGSLKRCTRVCEIGPGTGRYLEQVLRRVSPRQYDVYELDDAWAEWLAATYPITRRATDGETLGETPDASCDLVQAHNVFVYLTLLTAFRYFAEMARVCAPGGHLVFDYYPDTRVDEAVIEAWLRHPERYQVVLPHAMVLRFFEGRGFRLVHEFDIPCFRGQAHYVVLRRDAAGASGGALPL